MSFRSAQNKRLLGGHRDYAAAIDDFQAALTNWGGLSSELSTRLAQAIRAAEDSMAREQAHAATKIS